MYPESTPFKGGLRQAQPSRRLLVAYKMKNMTQKPIVIQIIGAPVACEEGVKDTWRQTAKWTAGQLATRFGAAVAVHYFDLFDPDCPPLPADAQLPLVLINGELFSSGGIISAPRIRRHLEGLGTAVHK